MPAGITHAAADDRCVGTFIFFACCGDGDIAICRDGYGIGGGPDGILPDQHLDRGGLVVLARIVYSVFQAVKLFAPDLADKLGQIEQYQLCIRGHIRKLRAVE